ncbi:MAG: transposase [Methanomassiliicoccales archaeon]|nr:transposase [Methanomassiliicoccales archaeon]NYT14715.1 transposase [Methanomassiliicoccales archaeon]
MKLLVCSEADDASVNIRDRILEMKDFLHEGDFDGHPVLRFDDMVMVTIRDLHIFAEDIDLKISERLNIEPKVLIFLSRHRAASGIPTLTVHPIGNHGDADFGGRERTLVPASPHLMTSMLRCLTKEAANLDYQVSFEVTHHGPHLSSPAIYIEIGSDESMWDDRNAAAAIARTVLHAGVERYPSVIGIGGGHYAPRFTEIALTRQVSFGHMVPNYALKGSDSSSIKEIILRALEKSEDTSMAYIHKKSMKRSEATSLKNMLSDIGVEVVEGKDLDPLESE